MMDDGLGNDWDDAPANPTLGDICFETADEDHVRRERAKARELRASQWWRNERGKGVCYYCHRHFPPKDLTMDHIVPIIRGGFSRRGNVVPCCKECNNKKKYLVPVEWHRDENS